MVVHQLVGVFLFTAYSSNQTYNHSCTVLRALVTFFCIVRQFNYLKSANLDVNDVGHEQDADLGGDAGFFRDA